MDKVVGVRIPVPQPVRNGKNEEVHGPVWGCRSLGAASFAVNRVAIGGLRVPEIISSSVGVNRRSLVGGGLGAMVLMAGGGALQRTSAHDSDDGGDDSLVGSYGVTRQYQVKEDADVDELVEKVHGFVDIIVEVDGFHLYGILYSDESRIWTAISVFDNEASAQASTEAAASYVAENELGGYFVDPSPAVSPGSVIIHRSTESHSA